MIRGTIRVLLALAVSAAVSPVAFLAPVLALGHPRAEATLRMACVRTWSRWVLRAVGIRLRVTGGTAPRPCGLIANHVSYVDICVVSAVAGSIFVSRADVRHWPVLGILARAGGTLFLERAVRRDARRVAGQMGARLALGYRIVFFPEGRTSRGDRLRPFRSPLFEAAVRAGVPCVPVAVRYTVRGKDAPDPHEVVSWDDESPFHLHAWRLANLKGVEVEVRVLPPRSGTDRKVLAAELEQDVRDVLFPDGEADLSAAGRTTGP